MDIDDLFSGFDGKEVQGIPAKTGEEKPEKRQAVIEPTPKKVKRVKKETMVVVTETQKVTTESGRSMTSFSVLPADFERSKEHLEEKPPAKQFKFELDPFQLAAIEYVEHEESVLVAAHTSAGKTAVAEYAIAKSLRDNQRVIYTSPIKALSNQKFRDLQAEFEEVGLLTGDVSINPQAKCLVMTTEILRSMLYRGSELCREVKWVIFDEIHYMRDRERGVVWEESIILLPHSVRLVFLSATIPNAAQFASWIATIHRQPCHVVYTDFRPTPLAHYIFAMDGLHLVVDEQSHFRRANFTKALDKLVGESGHKKNPHLRRDEQGNLASILSHVRAAELQPCIVFAFSKVKCEKNLQALKEAQYNDDEEAALVRQIYAAAVTSLSEEDRKLPQVSSLLSILERGVGIHHGGLLPLVKEVVEILFQEGLIKVLFATETFAIGINMPAKTVVFTELRKFDGTDFRLLQPSEYVQMSGRAGRRGKDERGTVILMLDDADEPEALVAMLQGRAEPLDSSYHVTYNMLLNLVRVEGADPEYLVRSSFRQFQRAANAQAIDAEAVDLQAKADAISVPGDEAAAKKLAALQDQIVIKRREFAAEFYTKSIVSPWLQLGRLIEIERLKPEWVVVKDKNIDKSEQSVIVLDTTTSEIESVPLSSIRRLSAVRIYADGIKSSAHAREAAVADFNEVMKRFPGDSLPLLDDVDDLKLQGERFETLRSQISALTDAANSQDSVAVLDALPVHRQKSQLLAEAADKRKQAKEARAMVLKDEIRRMRRVLRRLEHVNADGVITLKGRAACELNTADELVAAQLLLGGAFAELDPPEIAALLSCLVFTEKKSDDAALKQKADAPTLRPRLDKVYKRLIEAATEVYRAKWDSNVDIDQTDYLNSLNPRMMNLVFEWAKGANFVQLTKLTDAYEGTVVRVIRRLDELLRQLASAAHAIGNFDLKPKFESASAAIKRDIVFAASLYL